MKCKSKPQWDVTSFLLRWLLSKSQKENKYFWRSGKKGTLVHCWWEYKLVQSLWKTVWRFFKKLKIELPYEPATLLLVIYLQSTKSWSQRDLCTPMFTAALCTKWLILHGVTCIWNLFLRAELKETAEKWLLGVRKWEKQRKTGKRVQTFNYKIKIWGS